MAGSNGQDALSELDNLLQSMQSLKPPGVAKSKVDNIAKICTAQENAERQLSIVETILSNFQRSLPTHKLGVMYIVDTVTRQWIAAGNPWESGVQRITTVLPMLMSDLIRSAPDNQKEKIGKLIDIWVSCKTFPEQVLLVFKQQLNNTSTTANGSIQTVQASAPPTQAPVAPAPVPTPQPMAHAAPPARTQPPAPTNTAVNPLLAALSNFQRPAAPPVPPPMQNGYDQPANGYANAASYPVASGPPSSVPPPLVAAPSPAPASSGGPAPVDPNMLTVIVNALKQAGQNQTQQAQALQQLAQVLPQDQLIAVVTQLLPVPPPMAAAPAPVPAPASVQSQYAPNGPTYLQAPSNGYDYNAANYNAYAAENGNEYDRRDNAHESSNGGQNGYNEDRRGSNKSKGKRGNSPQQGRNRPHSPRNAAKAPRPLAFDERLAQEGKLKVLSRTLFVGGVRTGENELKVFFSRFGAVQSCIVNDVKRHAFLKLCSHQDATTVKVAVEALPHEEYRSLFERIGWAVGFGPTACADYQIGLSTIPIDVLTDADRRWMISSEFGGTGGKPLEPGVVVEEPDIEIGAGPSSKAISRRGGHNAGPQRGGNFNNQQQQHNKHKGGYERHHPYAKHDRKDHKQHNNHRHEQQSSTYTGPPPPVPTFGGGIPGLF